MKELMDLMAKINDSLDDIRLSFKECISTKEIKKQPDDDKQNKNGIYVDLEELKLIGNGREKQLTLNDCIIVKTLLNKKEKLCTYQELCSALYGYEIDEYALKSIKTAVCRVKAKVKGILRIKNIRERGFIAFEVKDNEGTE